MTINVLHALPDVASSPLDDAGPDHGAVVSIKGVSRRFGDKVVLNDLDLHIPPGQFVAVVGKSGCGKSTLLRLIAGLDQPTSGGISIDGGPTGHQASRIMFQEPRLLPWQRVVDNVAIGLPGNVPKSGRHGAARALLDQVGLDDRAREWPAVLSGGQKQRVALARALGSGPRLLSLDEPLGALDALTRIDMQRLLERIWLEQRFTAILVTHDVAEALALADRIIMIDAGAVTLDIEVPFARPRQRGSAGIARLEGQILDRLFNNQHLHPVVQDSRPG